MTRQRANGAKLRSAEWPCWFYGPYGESQIFYAASEVPYGWVKKPGLKFEPPPDPPVLDRKELENKLREMGIEPIGHWSVRYMKEILDGHSPPR
jgi:hypothetical protein